MVFNSLWEDPGVGDTAVVVCGQLAFFSYVPPKKGLVTLAKFFTRMLRDVQDSASNKSCPVER